MANLFTVQEHLSTLKTGTPEQKKSKLTPESIADVKAFIKSERENRPNGTHYSLEAEFHEWEDLIAKYEKEKGIIRAATAEAATAAYTAQGRRVDAGGKSGEKTGEVSAEMAELREEASVELRNILTQPTPEAFQQGIEFIEALSTLNIDAPWLDKNEKELLKSYTPTLRGIAGSIFTTSLAAWGYGISFDRSGQIQVRRNTRNPQDASADLSVKLNARITQSPGLTEILKAGLLYQGGTLEHYVDNLRDSNGKIMDSSKLTPDAYLKYLREKSNKSEFDKALLSHPASLAGINFASYAEGTKYIGAIVEQAEKYQSNPAVRNAFNPAVVNHPVATHSPAGVPKGNGSGQRNLSEGEQKAANFFRSSGNVLMTGFGNGLSSLGNILSEGGPLAWVGLIAAFIVSWKQFGFWKTIGGGLAGLTAYGSISKIDDTKKAWNDGQKGGTGGNEKQSEKAPESLPSRYHERLNNQISKLWSNPAEQTRAKEIIAKYSGEKYENLRTGLNGGTLSATASKMSPEEKVILKKYIDSLEQKTATNNLGETLDILRQNPGAFQSFTLDDINKNLFDLEAQHKLIDTALDDAIEHEKDPTRKAELIALKGELLEKRKSSSEKEDRESSSSILTLLGLVGGVGAFAIIVKWGVAKILTSPLTLVKWAIKNRGDIPGALKGLTKEKAEKVSLAEKAKGAYSQITDKLQGGMGVSDFEHMDGLKNHLASEGVDTKFLDEFKGKVTEIQKLHPGTATYLKKENELRAFLNTIDDVTRTKILAYAEAGKFHAPEQGKFVAGLMNAMNDAKKAPIATRGARFVASLFKKIK